MPLSRGGAGGDLPRLQLPLARVVDRFAQDARRFRRRVQADVMLVLIAVLMGAGSLVEPAAHPSTYVGIWVGVFVLVLWLILLAMADAAVSLHRGQQAKQELLAEKAKLEAELAARPRRPKSPG